MGPVRYHEEAMTAPRTLAALACLVLSTACGDDKPPCDVAGNICRIAGTGEAAFNGDGLKATDTAFYLLSAARQGPDGHVYLMDFNNMRLRRVEDDGTVSTVAGNGLHLLAREGVPAGDSPLENPVDFAFTPEGNIVLVSLHDPRVFLIDGAGTLQVVAGNGMELDGGDGGPARDASFVQLTSVAVASDGSIFVSDREAHRVRVIRPDGNIATYAGNGTKGYAGDGGPATDAALAHPEGLALDEADTLYIADWRNHAVRRVGADGVIATVAGSGTPGLSGDGGPATAAQLMWPRGVAAAGGILYIADTLNHRIRRVTPDGVIDTLAGSIEGNAGDGAAALTAALNGPSYLHVGEGVLYIADMLNHSARVVYLE
jgi:hypothetical protein